MRLVGTLKTQRQAKTFSFYLQKQQIANTIEPIEGDEGRYEIWVVDEDHVPATLQLLKEFQQNPDDPRFRVHPAQMRRLQDEQRKPDISPQEPQEKEVPRRRMAPFGIVTIFLIAVSLGCFFWGGFESIGIPNPKNPNEGLLAATPLYAALLFDFPRPLQVLEQLRSNYGVEELLEPTRLPPEGRKRLQAAFTYPFYQGIYRIILDRAQSKPNPASFDVPMFTKIREGQIWRLWTPVVLHGDILHLIFNLFWLVILGNQVEFRIGPWRYGLLTLLAGILSNIGQYLMSGPVFLGLSGVVLAYFGFIWIRQWRAPWEGYDLSKFILIFIGAWVLLMIILQLTAFFLELNGHLFLRMNIANTAHVVGLATGALFGLWDRLGQPRKT